LWVIQIAIAVRAEPLRKPCGVGRNPDPTSVNAENAACWPKRNDACPPNSKRQRNRFRNRARSQSDSTGILTLIGVKSYNPDV
jgi:hypothetical protein